MGTLPSKDGSVILENTDSFEDFRKETNESFPTIHGPCVVDGKDTCVLNISTLTQNKYCWLRESNGLDSAIAPVTAREIATKMVSRQKVWESVGYFNASFEETDKVNNCAEINQAAIDWAVQNAGKPFEFSFSKNEEG